MNGFSERSRELEVGHLLGLRWFQLQLMTHHTQAFESSVITDGTITCRCACGVTEAVPLAGFNVWRSVHHLNAEPVPVLHGARGRWQPGENVAECLSHRVTHKLDGIPVENCGCGFWAYWKLGGQYASAPHVVGIVKGYGNTIEGDKGFRCSHAAVEALFLPAWSVPAALALEQRYQVPVYHSIEAMLKMHRAPEGQPELRDGWFTHPHPGVGGFASGGVVNQRQASIAQTPPAMVNALTQLASPCQQCGTRACAADQPLCAACQILDARQAHRPQPCVACGAMCLRGQNLCSACQQKPSSNPVTMSGGDAQALLHTRREGWSGVKFDKVIFDEPFTLTETEIARLKFYLDSGMPDQGC